MFFGFKLEFEFAISILCVIGIIFFIIALIDDFVTERNKKKGKKKNGTKKNV